MFLVEGALWGGKVITLSVNIYSAQTTGDSAASLTNNNNFTLLSNISIHNLWKVTHTKMFSLLLQNATNLIVRYEVLQFLFHLLSEFSCTNYDFQDFSTSSVSSIFGCPVCYRGQWRVSMFWLNWTEVSNCSFKNLRRCLSETSINLDDATANTTASLLQTSHFSVFP